MSIPPPIFPIRSRLPLSTAEEFFEMCVNGCRVLVAIDENLHVPIVNIMTKEDGEFYDNMIVMTRMPPHLRPMIVKAMIRQMNAVACVVVQNPKGEDGEEHLTFSMQTLAETKFKAYRVSRNPFAIVQDEELEEPVEHAGVWAGLMLPPMRFEEA